MAQRISRAKRMVSRAGVDRPGDVRTVMRVLYLVFNEGYSGDVDLASEAIRLTRQLAGLLDDPEVQGLLALMLLHHARRRSRTRPDGSIVALADQDRSQWDTALITEGVDIVQARAVPDQLGEYQAQAAIAVLHADAPRVEETDWVQIVEWYDELLRFADTPIVRLNRWSPSARPTERPQGWRHWPRSTSRSRGGRRSRPTSTRRTAISSLPPASTPRQLATHPTSPNATTKYACQAARRTNACNTTRDLGAA